MPHTRSEVDARAGAVDLEPARAKDLSACSGDTYRHRLEEAPRADAAPALGIGTEQRSFGDGIDEVAGAFLVLL